VCGQQRLINEKIFIFICYNFYFIK
jgi:hypothetical protein